MDIYREVFIFIPEFLQGLFYLGSLIAIIIFLSGSYFRIRLWFRAPAEEGLLRQNPLRFLLKGLLYLLSPECLFARRVFLRSPLRAWMLILVYWGFLILFGGTVVVAIDHYLKAGILRGNIYLVFSLILDAGGLGLLIGTAFFISRRLFLKKEVLSGWYDLSVLFLLFIIVISGFSVEGIRLAITQRSDLSPVGVLFSILFQGASESLYLIFWFIHVLSALCFIAYIPFSKQFHMFASQITTVLSIEREGRLKELVHD
jgi:nitrate reductase gamma subunit